MSQELNGAAPKLWADMSIAEKANACAADSLNYINTAAMMARSKPTVIDDPKMLERAQVLVEAGNGLATLALYYQGEARGQ